MEALLWFTQESTNLSSGMAERLNNVAYNEISGSNNSSSGFNPRCISFDIRTPEELAAVNGFLLALGRDVSGIARYPPAPSHPPSLSTESYFDPTTLSQLGLAGMPGIPSNNFGFSDAPYNGVQTSNRNSYNTSARSSQSTFPGQLGGIYDIPDSYPISDYSRRSSKYSASSYSNQHQHPTPPQEINSPHSTSSTPVSNTPPQLPPDSFDCLRPSRNTSVAHLAPPDYMNKSVRQIVPLKSLPTLDRSPQPIQPKLPVALRRPVVPTNSAHEAPLNSGSLYPLLKSGDVQYRLPPLKKMGLSSQGTSQDSGSDDDSMQSTPTVQSTVLPGIRSITNATDFDDQLHLAAQVGGMELRRSPVQKETTFNISPEQRKMHAEFIFNLLVSINRSFKSRHLSSDVEMLLA